MKKVKEFFLKYYMYIFCAVIILMPLIYTLTIISKLIYAIIILVVYILFEVVDYNNKKHKTIK